MPTTTETPVTKLKLNRLTKAQYDAIATPSNTELYFVKDEAIDYNDLINTPNLATVATSGDYEDLINKPEIKQADWNQSDSMEADYIKNKPYVPTTTDSVTLGSTAALTSGGAYTNLVTDVVAGTNDDEIVVTKAGTPTTITIDNVANAENATNAVSATTAVTASKLGSVTVGSTSRPIYINNGEPSQIDYTIEKSVPSNAKFTDTTYEVFTGATSSTDGAAGLVKKPLAGDQNKYLRGDGNWDSVDALPAQSGENGKYLTTNGTSAFWNSLATVATSGSYADLSNKPIFNGIELTNTAKSFYGTSNTDAAVTQKEVTITDITSLEAGQIIIVTPTTTSSVANSTLKLNTFDPYPMRYSGAAITTSTDSIVWAANVPAVWLFDGTYWHFLGHGIDNNTTYSALAQTYSNAKFKAGGSDSYALTRYSLVLQKPDGTWEKMTATNAAHNVNPTKAVNTSGFILGQIKYYYSTAVIAGGEYAAVNTLYEKHATVDMRYSTNCGATPGWTDGEYVYIVGTIGADGLFYLDTTTWWTQTLPSTNDGKLYVQLGRANTGSYAYYCGLDEEHPVFYHDGTSIKEYKVADNKQDILVSGTNIKTINGSTLLGSGNLTVDTLPSQSGKNGKYLTTDGTDPSWADIPTELPTQTGQSGKYLTTNGSDVSWANVPTELPAQSGQNGKFLTTNGTNPSWTSLSASDIPNLTLSKITDVTATATEVNILDGITASTSELNILDGVTASTAEINILDGITATTTELNYVGGVTSSIQTQLDDKVAKNNSTQAKAYGTTSGGVETTWKVSSSASASSLAYRGTDGVLAVGTPTSNEHAATKAYVDAVIPSQSGNSGKYLTTNGTTVSWATVNALPSQSGNAGKYLTTNGTTASWVAIEEYTANEVETLWNSI